MITRLWTLVVILVAILPAHAQEPAPQPTVTIGVAPNLWWPQVAVIAGEKWEREYHFNLRLQRVPGPAHMVQAFVSGDMDGMTNNLAAGLLARNHGVPCRYIVATVHGDISLLAQGYLKKFTDSEEPLSALKRFPESLGRKVRIVTNPRGSLSDLNLRIWLNRQWPTYTDHVQLIHAGDQAQLQQIFMSKSADLMSAFSPLTEIATARDASVFTLVPAETIGAVQAGAALILSEQFINRHPSIATAFQELFQRATDFIRQRPEDAVAHVDKFLMQGALSPSLLLQALRSMQPFLASDITPMLPALWEVQAMMVLERYITKEFSLEKDLLFRAE